MKGLRFATFVLTVVLVTAVPLPATASAQPIPFNLDAIDISTSVLGQHIRAAAIARFETAAEAHDATLDDEHDYDVYVNVPGDLPNATWVVPKGSPPPVVRIQAGSVYVTEPLESPDIPESDSEDEPPYMHDGAAKCSARYEPVNTGGWQDRCGQFSTLMNDGDPALRHYTYKHWATCSTPQAWWLTNCRVNGYLAATSAVAGWEDWAPKSDSSGACRSINLAVSVGALTVSGDYTGCETNRITKGEGAGTFASEWSGTVNGQSRSAEYRVAISSPSSAGTVQMQPQFNFSQSLVH